MIPKRNSNYREVLAKKEALQATLARLSAEARGIESVSFPEEIAAKRPDLVDREKALFEKRIKERDEQKDVIDRSLYLAKEELSMTVPLVRKKIVSKVEQLRLEREVNELEGKNKELIGGFQQKAMELRNEVQAELEGINELIKGGEDEVRRGRGSLAGIWNREQVVCIYDRRGDCSGRTNCGHRSRGRHIGGRGQNQPRRHCFSSSGAGSDIKIHRL